MSVESEANAAGMSFVEKHLQTMIMAALGAVCAWMAMTTQNLTVSVATLTEKVSNLQEQIGKQGDNNYGADISDLKARVTVLEAAERRKDER